MMKKMMMKNLHKTTKKVFCYISTSFYIINYNKKILFYIWTLLVISAPIYSLIIHPLYFGTDIWGNSIYQTCTTPTVEELKEEVDYWQKQTLTYKEALSTFDKPEHEWTQDEKASVEELKSIDGYDKSKVQESLKDNQKNLSNSIKTLKGLHDISQPSLGKRTIVMPKDEFANKYRKG